MQLKNPTERHLWKRFVELNKANPHNWIGCGSVSADDLYMAAVMHEDLPGTLTESTVRRYLSKWWNAGMIGKRRFGRSTLYRLATV